MYNQFDDMIRKQHKYYTVRTQKTKNFRDHGHMNSLSNYIDILKKDKNKNRIYG